MKKLELEIKKNGFVYKQEHRTDNVALYSQWDEGRIICYEVFRIWVQKAREWNGKTFPEKEVYPRDEDFGYSAWAPNSLQRAESIYDKLVLDAQGGVLAVDGGTMLQMDQNVRKDKASGDLSKLKKAS